MIDTDVLVIGGGPAGSTVATLLAKEGLKVFIAEKEKFPRYKIGESLLPSALQIFDILGVREKVENHGFVKKCGAFLRWGTEPDPWHIKFGELLGQEGYSFQVIRSEFDHLLLKHAASCGAKVQESTEISSIIFENERPVQAKAISNGIETKIKFKYLVDCSGRNGILATQYLKNRRYHEAFKNIAIWSYWKNANRLPEPYNGSILTAAINDGWIWSIPLHDGSQSMGVVLHKDVFQKLSKESTPDEIYMNCIQQSKIALDLINGVKSRSEIKVTSDYSYNAGSFSGPGYYLCGDAACFLDPVLSSGVHLAMYSGLMAASSIAATEKKQVKEKEAIQFYDSIYRRTFTRFAEFLSAFYAQNKSKDGYFWDAQKVSSADVSSSDLRLAFIGLISGMNDLTDSNVHEGISTELSAQVSKNLNFRKKGENLHNSSGKLRDEIFKNGSFLSRIEALSGTNSEDDMMGLYATTSPSLGLCRTKSEALPNEIKV